MPRPRPADAPGEDALEQCVFLTLILLLLYSPALARLPLSLLAVVALILPRVRASASFWLACALALFAAALARWWSADNHEFLEAYWCLALACALRERSPASLAVSARYLVGFAFLLAVGWKLASADYRSGEFFAHTLLLDPRFRGFGAVAAGISDPARELAVAARAALVSYDGALASVPLVAPGSVDRVAWALTLGTVACEAGVALGFLFALPRRIAFVRHALLIGFILAVYSVATVVGFGWTLATMGIAQCRPDERWARRGYLASIILLQAYRFPWAEMARGLVEWIAP